MVPVVFQAESVDQTDAQLKMERLYQAATHVMVQRSAVLQIDLHQTAEILRKTTQDAVHQEMLLLEAQTRCDQERSCSRKVSVEKDLSLSVPSKLTGILS
ncbi:hypothetical protein ABBQ38_006044 [Trebouxia sp. C0009 RCD-2024]